MMNKNKVLRAAVIGITSGLAMGLFSYMAKCEKSIKANGVQLEEKMDVSYEKQDFYLSAPRDVDQDGVEDVVMRTGTIYQNEHCPKGAYFALPSSKIDEDCTVLATSIKNHLGIGTVKPESLLLNCPDGWQFYVNNNCENGQ